VEQFDFTSHYQQIYTLFYTFNVSISLT